MDTLDRDHPFADHFVEHRKNPLDILLGVDDLDDDGKIVRMTTEASG